ncbi:MAG: hypothetical protein V4727_11240 [Verrucomicrobiota bacterium]
MSVKLLGFAAVAEVTDHDAFAAAIRSELEAVRDLLGANMVVLSGAGTDVDLIFLRTCIELRIPTIVLLPSDEPFISETDPEKCKLLENLLSVSLAKYPLPPSTQATPILEWADALLCACCDDEEEILTDALALGIPTKKLHSISLESNWTHPPHPASPARHGFPTRRELLEFLDKRFGSEANLTRNVRI